MEAATSIKNVKREHANCRFLTFCLPLVCHSCYAHHHHRPTIIMVAIFLFCGFRSEQTGADEVRRVRVCVTISKFAENDTFRTSDWQTVAKDKERSVIEGNFEMRSNLH
jgi:hypothetical protein